MKTCLTKLPVLFFLLILITTGCNNSDSSKNKNTPEKLSQLIGTWQQTAIGDEKVSGIVVKIIFSEHTLTMDAPGCLIIGDYIIDNEILTYTVTAVQGERCSKQQITGQSASVHFDVTTDQLSMTPLNASSKSRAMYKRIE